MDRAPYESDFERQKKLLVERYMRLHRSRSYDSSEERHQWQKTQAKNRYDPAVRINNWTEESCDVDYARRRNPVVYEAEYVARFGDHKDYKTIPIRREPRIFPGHQPELDPPQLKAVYNSYETTSRVAYQNPRNVTTRKNEANCPYCRILDGQVRN